MLGRHGDGRGSATQQVHDGDTIIVEAAGNISVRFLGVDTPEVSFTLPGSTTFRGIGGADWQEFLDDPFAGAPESFPEALGEPLEQHLRASASAGSATNHAFHAERAHRHLERLVDHDMLVLGQDKTTFHFFLAFATEVMDGFARLLCFINREQEHETIPEPRPLSYNERLLQAGMASPYFIWPNINPFRSEPSVVDAVPSPGDIGPVADGADGLGPARQWVKNARQGGAGVFASNDPLRLQPFELRMLARRQAPSRWVIDLSNPSTNTLLPPKEYVTIPNVEDRLFVPTEYVPLFRERGWQ
jgi:hypothetical protein